jgi:two-component system, LytTR family, sensor kinase
LHHTPTPSHAPAVSQASALTRGVIYFAAWTAVALVTTQLQYFAQPAGGAEPYLLMLRLALASCWLWALFTPGILWFARVVPIDRSNWPRTIAIHLVASAVVTVIDIAILREVSPLLNPGAPPRPPLHVSFLRQYFLYTLCYFVIVALQHVRYYASLSTERDLRAAQLEAQLSAARLTALQGQLRPHFLFNTLNMIAEQVHTDPAGADAMLTRLGVLLRSSFVETDRERVPLRRELELLESYVEIMQGRFSRLSFALDIEPATLDALVPRFMLQPLVENAIKHGVEPREEGGQVIVRASRHGDSVTLEVRDNGDGLMGTIREGTGVRNTRERLLHLYGEGRQRFDLATDPEGGTVATVTLPFDTDDGPPDSFTVPTAPEKSSVTPVRREPAVPPSAAAPVRAATLRRRTS